MAGIVIVSHSRKLAHAVTDLVRAMNAEDPVRIAYAGGVAGGEDELGTDATDIMTAIESVYGDDGVIVFVDMGSAILSAEMALELLGEPYQSNVRISAAPLVEGAISAAVQASGGVGLKELMRETRQALYPKQQQLGLDGDGDDQCSPDPSAKPTPKPTPSPDELTREYEIRAQNGLHARPAAKLVRTIGRYECEAQVWNATSGRGPASGRSLNQLMALEIGQGQQLRVTASGEPAAALLQAVADLVADNFGEAEVESSSSAQAKEPEPKGAANAVALAEGIGVGPAFVIGSITFDVEEQPADEPAAEVERIERAIGRVCRTLEARLQDNAIPLEQREIFEAHEVLLQDPELVRAAADAARKRSIKAEAAWSAAVRDLVSRYEGMEDPYLRSRATDVKDIGAQVLLALDANAHQKEEIPDGAIVVAEELTPSETVSLDLTKVQGLVTARGGPTSHTAILARGMGLPAIGGYADVAAIHNGDLLVVDGFKGSVTRSPDEATAAAARKRRDEWLAERQRIREQAKAPARTRDGHAVTMLANVAVPTDVATLAPNGAEGIGLLRTEFLFLNRRNAPSLQDQMAYFDAIFDGADQLSVTVRTFDIGGDKRIAYLDQEAEENPFLGVRGIRLYEHNEKLFDAHIEAILRSGVGHRVSVLFPMVAKVAEFTWARERVEKVHARLEKADVPHLWPVDCGVMIETPASVALAPDLAREAAFFSIGTNDLTQYMLAAERGNARLNRFVDSWDPAVLRSILAVADAGAQAGIAVSVCGELGGDREALPLLLGLGITKLSANPGALPALKLRTAELNLQKLREQVPAIVREESSAGAVRRRLAKLIA